MALFTVGYGSLALKAQQQKIFYAEGLWWLFYLDGIDIVYTTSRDGASWSTKKKLLDGGGAAENFSICYDGTYIHYAYSWDGDITYRRGKPNSDGTITWSAPYQTISEPEGAWFPSITVDSNRYPWIGYKVEVAGVYKAKVTKSSKNDGTWTTEDGFPVVMSSGSTYRQCCPIALSGGKVLVIYPIVVDKIKAKLYDGGWGDEENASSSTIIATVDSETFNASMYEDVVHMTFSLWSYGGIRKILYVQRSASGAWSAEETVKSGDTSNSANPNISLDSKGVPYIASLWSDGLRIFKRKAANEWVEALVTLEKASTGTLQATYMTRNEQNKRIGIMLAEGTVSPYTIKFMPLTFLPANIKTAPNSGL